jgi:hypothetical protein
VTPSKKGERKEGRKEEVRSRMEGRNAGRKE